MTFALSRLLWLCLCFWLAFTNGLLANWSSREGVVTTPTTYHYNAANQLTSTTGAQTLSYTYDANGNRVTRTEGLLTDAYSYDRENRLIELDKHTGAGTGSYVFAYDYRTRRIQSTHGTASTKFIFSGSTSVQEIENGLHSAEYIRGPDLGGGVGGLLYSLRSGGASYTHSNTRGDIIAKSNSTGTLTYEAQYEGYGQVTSESGSTLDRQRSNSKKQDIPGYANEGYRYRDLESGAFLTKDPLGFVDGPNLYAYVRQNPWTMWDPEGLAGERVDDDGFKWSSRDHHVVPAQVARDAGWHPDAKAVFDKSKIETPNGHNFTKHAAYNAEVSAEMSEFIQQKGIKNIGGMSARQQTELAQEFVASIQNTSNKYIKGFNEAVPEGSAAVRRWFAKEGKNVVLKSTGKTALTKGAKVVTGIAKLARVGGVMSKGVPLVGGILAAGVSAAQGKTSNEVATDVLMSVTNGDIAQWALEENPVTKAGTKLIEGGETGLNALERQLDILDNQ